MHRAGQRSVALAIALAPAMAWAFHAGNQFDKPSGAGGGGGIFYTGGPRDHGWDCTACHTGAPRTIRLDLSASPPSLFAASAYAPGAAYAITVQLAGEHAGLASPQSNYNGLAVAAVDARGAPAGTFSGYAPDDLYDGSVALASAGKQVGVTRWTFTWTAPAAGTGTVTLHLCAVDGDGASSPPGVTLTDPFGDDVVVGAVPLAEGSVSFREPFAPLRDTGRMSHAIARLDPPLARAGRLLRRERRRARRARFRRRLRPAR